MATDLDADIAALDLLRGAPRDRLRPGSGGEFEIETITCHEIRQSHEAVVIDHVAEDPAFAGTLDARSTADETRFTFRMPLRRALPDEPANESPPVGAGGLLHPGTSGIGICSSGPVERRVSQGCDA